MVREIGKDPDKQIELANCTFVKTVLMLLVVLYHCVVYWTGTWFTGTPVHKSSVLAEVASWMNSFHIYGFTLVSGYLFYYLRYEKGKYGQFLPFMTQKVKRLLIPFVFICFVWVAPINYLFFPFEWKAAIGKFVLGTAPAQLWFLLMLFGVFALFYPISNFVRDRQILGAVLILGIYGVGLAGQIVLPNVFQVFRACMYIPLFWLGFKLRQWGSSCVRKIPAVLWVIAHVCLFLLVRYLSGFTGMIFTLLRLGFDFVLHIVGALMAFTVLQKLADKVNWKNSKVFAFLSKMSMPVYLLHQQVIYVFVYLLNGALNPYVHAAVNFAGAMAVSLLLSAVLMKFRITRTLIGEK